MSTFFGECNSLLSFSKLMTEVTMVTNNVKRHSHRSNTAQLLSCSGCVERQVPFQWSTLTYCDVIMSSLHVSCQTFLLQHFTPQTVNIQTVKISITQLKTHETESVYSHMLLDKTH